MYREILLLIFTALVTSVSAQPYPIRGTLKSGEGRPVPYANVIIRNTQNRIVAFNASDTAGNFVIILPPANRPDSMRLQINHLGYTSVDTPLTPIKHHYNIRMEEQSIDLSEVEVKSRPRIDTRGDTLEYDVGSFAGAEDRSIGDVLRRMPGIEVSESGAIKFNGQAIANFYIDGDDQLDDRYSVGTKTIPHAMVKGIEVLQNHQPLNVLRNKELSNRVSLNLVIKDEAKLRLTGQVKLGAGLPHQYDGELNSILFNKKYKMLNLAKANNVGTDLTVDFTAFNVSNILSAVGNSRPSTLLFTGTAGNPALPKHRYYLNNSGSINANNLVNLRNGLQLKSNVNLLLDRNKLAYNSYSELYLGDDTIRYTERQDIGRDPFLTDVSLTAMANNDNYYFSNILKVAYSGETGASSLLSNNIDMSQRLRNRVRDFSNTLEYTPALGNRDIVYLSWYLNHYNQPQTLTIRPGINADVLNEGVPFRNINQFAETPTWFSRASAAYRLTKGIIKQRYRGGMVNEWQQLRSALRLTQADGRETTYSGSEDNNLYWNRHQLFVDGTYEYERGRMEASLTLPLTGQRITYIDPNFGLDEQVTQLLFNPLIQVKRMINAEDYVSFNYSFTNQIGNINGVFRGAILDNYRNIRANDAALQEQRGHNTGLRYHFQRAIKMLFINAGISYNQSMANTIASSVVTDDIVRTVLLPFHNDVSSVNADVGISKYIFALGATASLKSSWSTIRSNQLLNDESLPFSNISFMLSPGIEARLFGRISITYDGTGTWMTSRLIGREAAAIIDDRQIRLFDQSVALTYSPFRNTFLRINGRHQYTSQQQAQDISYFFVDANIRHRLNKWHTELELDLTNLANITAYETYGLSANRFSHSQYRLRGRMAVLKCMFNL